MFKAMVNKASDQTPEDDGNPAKENEPSKPKFAKIETMKKFQKGMTKLRFLTRMSDAAKQPPTDDDYFIPQSRRRFMFDNTAIGRGGSVTDLFKAEDKPEEDFDDIVDQDESRMEVFVSQELVGQLIESVPFKIFIFALIVVNAILIGLQTSEKLSEEYRLLFSIFDQCVLATFTCEILLKWYYGFWIFWKVGWNILDFTIILALLLGPQLSFISSSRILRILRVLRAFRSLRSVSALAGLSTVVQTILQSIPDMANICLLLGIILLVLGVMGVTLFGKYVPSKFGTLQTAIFSLFICLTQDGWVEIFTKFTVSGFGPLYVGGVLYFFVSIMVCAFVFANLVVAVVVTNLEMAMRELKAEKAAEVDTLATNPVQDDFIHFPENKDKAPILVFEKFKKTIEFPIQTPLLKVDINHINVTKLEHYLLLIAALEDNLAEYMDIKKDLTQMYEVINGLNLVEEDEFEEVTSPPPRGSNVDMSTMTGDILSNIMELTERGKISVRDDHSSLTDIIRTARQPVQTSPAPRKPKQ